MAHTVTSAKIPGQINFQACSLLLLNVKMKKTISKLPTQKKLYSVRYLIWLGKIVIANQVNNRAAEINIPFREILMG